MILVVDVKGMAYRGTWSVRRTDTPQGRDVTPFFGFIRILLSTLRRFPGVSGLVMCCDPIGGTHSNWRRELLPEYKANRANPNSAQALVRKAVDDNLPLIRQFTSHLNAVWMEDPDFEADDLIAWVAGNFRTDVNRVILGNDRDLFQLVLWPNTEVAFAHKKKYVVLSKDNFAFTILDVIAKANWTPKIPLPPEYWVALKCLGGDTSDNIPGIPRVQVKTAYKIICEAKAHTTSHHPWELLRTWAELILREMPRPLQLASAVSANQQQYAALLERNRQLIELDPRRPVQCRGGWNGTYSEHDLFALMGACNFTSLLTGGKFHHDLRSAAGRLRCLSQ